MIALFVPLRNLDVFMFKIFRFIYNISYIYSASGQKLAKRQVNGTMRYYASGIEYNNDRKVDLIHPEEVERLRGFEV